MRAVLLAQKKGTHLEHPIEQAMLLFLQGKQKDPDVEYAYEIYSNEQERDVLNAWFLSGADEKDVYEHLRIPEKVSKVYMHLFFDVTRFRDELDVYSWVIEMESDYSISRTTQQLYRQALMGGVDSMAWVYSRNREQLNPRKVLENIMADSYFRAKMNRNAPINSQAGKDAQSYMATALKAGDLLARHSPQQSSGVADLIIKLEHTDTTIPVSATKETEYLH